jgi:hypothetical protein
MEISIIFLGLFLTGAFLIIDCPSKRLLNPGWREPAPPPDDSVKT